MIFAPLNSKKEMLDQIAHTALGLIFLLAFVFPVPLWAAALLVMAVAVWREIEQRHAAGMSWWDCQAGCRLDLLFWLAGAFLGTVVYLLRGWP